MHCWVTLVLFLGFQAPIAYSTTHIIASAIEPSNFQTAQPCIDLICPLYRVRLKTKISLAYLGKGFNGFLPALPETGYPAWEFVIMEGIDHDSNCRDIQVVSEHQPLGKYDVVIVGAGPAGLTLAYVGNSIRLAISISN